MSKTIYLIGFMGCGKTTLGCALASTLHDKVRFIDLDSHIESITGMTIPEIFKQKGEATFRQLESQTLKDLHNNSTVTIIACGGGTACRQDNIEYMLQNGTVILLDAPIDTLVRRLCEAPEGSRPMLNNIKTQEQMRRYVIEMQQQRMPFYSKAQHVFSSDLLENAEEIAHTVKVFIDKFLPEYSNNTNTK